MGKSYEYIHNVDFTKFDRNIWSDTSKLPSCSGFREVIIIKEKHGKDAEVVCAEWIPRDGYKQGDFWRYIAHNHKIKVDNSKILLWRSLDYL